MTAPSQDLHPPEYYLKYMSWHTKDMAECMKQISAGVNSFNGKLEQLIDMQRQAGQGKPHSGVAKVTPMPPSSEEVPF